MLPAGMTLRHHSPIHGFTDFQELYQSNHGTAGNHEAGSFVNSTVTVQFTKLLAELFLTSPGTIPVEWKKSLKSTIHKADGLTVPGHSMILPGTIPETPISREWIWWLE